MPQNQNCYWSRLSNSSRTALFLLPAVTHTAGLTLFSSTAVPASCIQSSVLKVLSLFRFSLPYEFSVHSFRSVSSVSQILTYLKVYLSIFFITVENLSDFFIFISEKEVYLFIHFTCHTFQDQHQNKKPREQKIRERDF